jgi:hypothetical protein
MVSHGRHRQAILVLTGSGDGNLLDRGLKLDQGVCLVMGVGGAGLAVGTEVGVIAHCALVASADDVGGAGAISAGIAERAVTADTNMGRAARDTHPNTGG